LSDQKKNTDKLNLSARDAPAGPVTVLDGHDLPPSADYRIKLQIFEGPLDLLLHLIKVNEMEITEIAISEITGQYLEYLHLMESLDLEIAGDYLVMAATILNIKLRALLPAQDDAEEEEEELDDYMSARNLMQKLIEYRRFKEAALDLGERAEAQAELFYREVALPKLDEAQKDPALEGDLQALLAAFSRVIHFVEQRDYHQVEADDVSVEDLILRVRQKLFLENQFSIYKLFEECQSRVEMVICLFALLELCRLKELRIEQGENFGDMTILAREADPKAISDQLAEEASELERLEKEIIMNRTGVIDDEIPADEEAALPDHQMQSQKEIPEPGSSDSGAEVIELTRLSGNQDPP
jgi:segregation and condensation protein A